MTQYVIVGIMVVVAAFYLARTILRKLRNGGCDNNRSMAKQCDESPQCEGCALRNRCKK